MMSVARVSHFALHTVVMTRAAVIITILACIAGLSTARAQDVSPWDTELHAAARLIAGAVTKSADRKWSRAGIEIRLDPGWKTYWRYPGDSGVPPTFDFAGSENVKSVTSEWPAPHRFADGAGGYSIGYVDDVVLPLHVVAQDPFKPSSLHLKLGYAVCGNLCVPAQADLTLAVSGKAGTEETALAAAEARVPRRVPLGSESGGLAVRSVHRETDGAHQRIVVDVAAPDGTPVDLFAEGPTPDWSLPLPVESPTQSANMPGVRRFAFALDGLPPGTRAEGATLTLTLVAPAAAIEVAAHLD